MLASRPLSYWFQPDDKNASSWGWRGGGALLLRAGLKESTIPLAALLRDYAQTDSPPRLCAGGRGYKRENRSKQTGYL